MIPLYTRNISEYASKTSIKYGLLIALFLIVYFWTAYFLNFIDVPELRLFNIVIQMVEMYYALREFRRSQGGSLNYFRGSIISFGASIIGTSIFSLFLFTLLSLDHPMFQNITRGLTFESYYSPFTISIGILIEGMVSGAVGAFIIINAIETDEIS